MKSTVELAILSEEHLGSTDRYQFPTKQTGTNVAQKTNVCARQVWASGTNTQYKILATTTHDTTGCVVGSRRLVKIIPARDTKEFYQFDNRAGIEQLIAAEPVFADFLKALQVWISSFVGRSSVQVKYYDDAEEGWQALRVTIKATPQLEDTSSVEDALYALLDEEQSFTDIQERISILVM